MHFFPVRLCVCVFLCVVDSDVCQSVEVVGNTLVLIVLVREPDQGNTFIKLVKNTRQNFSKLVKFLLRMFY